MPYPELLERLLHLALERHEASARTALAGSGGGARRSGAHRPHPAA